jgi:cobalt-zinc-cadmium efflux system membrane fusion protein
VSGIARVVHVMPTALVLIALGAVGYWGHHHGWTIPKFSELAGNQSPTGAAWCE